MGVFEESRAVVLVGDYIGVDSAGKVNAIGAGFTLTGRGPNGHTPPQSVMAIIDIPSRYAGDQCAVALELRDETTGAAVQVQSPNGNSDTLRISQVALIDRPQLPGVIIPQQMFCRVQVAVSFAMGLPLEANKHYSWRLAVDGHHRKGWEAHFFVLGTPPPPVFGGPAGPADIPSVTLG
jgi:hypothetical protein